MDVGYAKIWFVNYFTQTKIESCWTYTLPSDTSYALQPLDVTCFKPFKTKFKKERDGIMASRNYTKLDKIILLHGAQGPRSINH